jgi:hypothetical protein
LRRAEIGVHHHVAGAYRSRYAQKSSWREDHGGVSNHYQLNRVACAPTTPVNPVVSKSAEQAAVILTGLRVAGLDCPASSKLTQLLLGWQPTQPGLIADVDHPCYFKTRTNRAVATQLAAPHLSPIVGVAESR